MNSGHVCLGVALLPTESESSRLSSIKIEIPRKGVATLTFKDGGSNSISFLMKKAAKQEVFEKAHEGLRTLIRVRSTGMKKIVSSASKGAR